MRSLILVVASTVALGGCAAAVAQRAAPPEDGSAAVPALPSAPNPTHPAADAPGAPASLPLANTRWRFARVHGREVPSGVRATLMFDGNARISGHAGCNGFGGTSRIGAGGSLRFGSILSTKMACLEPAGAMQAERGVFAALGDTVGARLQNGSLLLIGADGAVLATLQSQ